MKNLLEKLKAVLIKRAKGYSYKEEVEEYQATIEKDKKSVKDSVSQQLDFSSLDINFNQAKNKSQMVLIKKKITKHHMPPDLAAIKLLIEYFTKDEDQDLTLLSDTELLKLRDQLIDQLKNYKEKK